MKRTGEKGEQGWDGEENVEEGGEDWENRREKLEGEWKMKGLEREKRIM